MNKVTDDSLDYYTSLVSSGKCVMKFSAIWCGPCKALEQTILEIEQNYSDITFFEVDVDECNSLASVFNIRSVPTLIFYKDGKAVDLAFGNIGKTQLEEKLKNL